MHGSFYIVLIALGISLALRSWRMLRGGALLTPVLTTLVLLPWMWALPCLHIALVQLQWSGVQPVLLGAG